MRLRRRHVAAFAALSVAMALASPPGATAAPRAGTPRTYFGGYHTVAEQYAHLDTVAAAFPNLAHTVDYGRSWLRGRDPARGFPLRAICLSAPSADPAHPSCTVSPGGKPKLVVISAIHSREIVTAEIAYRLVDWLTGNYLVDADARSILDNSEVWVVPQANPDGSNLVASTSPPLLQRKNLDDTARGSNRCALPPTATNQGGVDLNRNFSVRWAADPDVCDQPYPGPNPLSEPESAALAALITGLTGDFWPPTSPHALHDDADAVVLSLHSFANVVVYPSEFSDVAAPDRDRLSDIALRMAGFDDWVAGQPSAALDYTVSGGFEDFAYFDRGVPAFAWEIGPQSGTCGGFTPPFACVDGFFDQTLPALSYTARIVERPWRVGVGPQITAMNRQVVAPHTLRVTVSAADRLFGQRASTTPNPPTRTITRMRYRIDAPPGGGHGYDLPLVAVGADGTATGQVDVDIGGLTPGQHMVYVRAGTDQDGPYSARFFHVP